MGAVPLVMGNVPQRIMNFTGRADILEKLRQSLSGNVTAVLAKAQQGDPPSQAQRGDPLPQALQGLGGVGKTAVAIEYAHRYQSNYQLVWWVPSDQLALVRSSLAALADPLGLKSASASGIEAAATAVLDALRRGEPYSRWLLIFDNADQPEDLEPLIPRGPGHVLITSRNHRWQSVTQTVPMDVFTRAESKEFLTKRVRTGLTEYDADRLAESLGDLPLALEQAGALVAETGMPVDDYVDLVDQHTRKIMAEGKSPEYPLSMTAAWTISVSALRQQLPQALELLRCCAFFAPDPIPRDVFRSGTQAGSQVGRVMADPILLARAIRELGRLALVKIDGSKISVHRLIQALLRDELEPDEQAAYRDEVHSILAASVPKYPNDSRLWPRYAELVAHAGSRSTDMAHCRRPEHRAFALDIIRYLYLSGDLASCRSFAEQFIAQWTADSGPDEATVLDARRHLGNVLRELGDYPQAYSIIEETLRRAGNVLGATDPLTLTLRNSFGADLRARGDFKTARELDGETLSLHTEVFGAATPQTWRVMNNLAEDHGLNSDYVQAKELHQRVYLLLSEAPSGSVPPTEVLTSWTGLARDLRLCGSFTEARDVGEDAYDFGRVNLGAEHYQTLRAANDLSIAFRRIPAAHGHALELAQEVFDLSGRLFGERNPDTMAAAISLTNIQRTMGRTEEALSLAKSTVTNYPAVYGPDHPYNYGCMGNLAVLLRLTGDPAEARRLNETALAKLDTMLTRDHFYSLTVAINLASDFTALGDIAAAAALGRDSLARARSRFGDRHPFTLGCAANLSVDLRVEGAEKEADELLAETLSHYEATLGADHSEAKDAAARRRLNPDFDPPPI